MKGQDKVADKGEQQQQQQGGGGSLIDQAMNALQKAGKEAVISKLKEIMKRKMEHEKGIALCDQEAAKLVDDFEKGLI